MNFQSDLKRFIDHYEKSQQPIVQFRAWKLKAMSKYYEANGFPDSCRLTELSLLPAYFQEAIYDGIDWWEQDTDTRHLTTELNLDCMFHNSGKTRKELSSAEFQAYVDFSHNAVHNVVSKPKSKPSLFSLLLAKIGSLVKG